MIGKFKATKKLILFFVGFLCFDSGFSQKLNSGMDVLEEAARRSQLIGDAPPVYSFQLRPLGLFPKDTLNAFSGIQDIFIGSKAERQKLSKVRFSLLPVISSSDWNTKRPYGWGNKGMVPNVGFQTYFSTGFFAKFYALEIQFQPEYVFAQNKSFQGFSSDFATSIIQNRFFYWNNGDNPERFGNEPISKFWWGQSSIMLNFGPIATGISSENIWWGPGQFNSLTFSDNAQGFPHLSLGSNRPIRTFAGNFEFQLIVGRLENSLLEPSQNEFLNDRYFLPFDGDWRYLNGMHINYNPSFLPNLFLGFNRTFQQYNKYRIKDFDGYFPIFEVFQKKTLFENGNSVNYDGKGQDQQVTISFRYLVPKANFEVYGEFGRRDHSYDWRDFILNPEHARAYIFGFQKLIKLPLPDEFIQVRGEVTHQQESINRYARYPGLIGNQTWHTHGLARGFVNYGQSLGVGAGVGSNVQTIEISKVKNLNKRGIVLERLANNQDFFYRAFGQNPEKKPWIDLSLGFLWDEEFDRLILSGKAQFIKSYNYQWQSDGLSTEDYPNGQKLLSFYGSFNLIYRFSK